MTGKGREKAPNYKRRGKSNQGQTDRQQDGSNNDSGEWPDRGRSRKELLRAETLSYRASQAHLPHLQYLCPLSNSWQQRPFCSVGYLAILWEMAIAASCSTVGRNIILVGWWAQWRAKQWTDRSMHACTDERTEGDEKEWRVGWTLLTLPFWRELYDGPAVTDRDLLWRILVKAGCESVCVGVLCCVGWLVSVVLVG